MACLLVTGVREQVRLFGKVVPGGSGFACQQQLHQGALMLAAFACQKGDAQIMASKPMVPYQAVGEHLRVTCRLCPAAWPGAGAQELPVVGLKPGQSHA